MMKIKRFGVISVAKTMGAIYALLGFIGGLIILVIMLIVGNQADLEGFEAIVFGIGAPIILPIFYGTIGFVGGVISAVLYNMIARKIGGIEVTIEDKV